MSIHISAKKGEIAETVLLPGDPLRARYLAEHFFEDAVCYDEVRGMLGFSGKYDGKKVSVQGTGMGVPSTSIYVNELIADYGVRNLIRVGTCGAIQPDLRLRDIILVIGASTDSHVNRLRFNGMDFAPTANFELLEKANTIAAKDGIISRIGPILTTDSFYHDDPDYWKLWAGYGILALEMETSALYTLAAKHQVRALSILTVSDLLPTGERATAEERQSTFGQMAKIALKVASDL